MTMTPPKSTAPVNPYAKNKEKNLQMALQQDAQEIEDRQEYWQQLSQQPTNALQ